MKRLVIGLLAHVDSGKTTLAEGLLYRAGVLRKLGRVDHRDAFLDTDALERERGITIFSKQAMLRLDDCSVTLLDTPGHVDFSAEMERTLQVLDYAVLVVSGTSGVQGHTHTLWQLLRRYQIPTFLFVNKMDIDGTDREALLHQLKAELSEGCIDFGADSAELSEQLALLDDEVAERYLESGTVSTEDARQLIARRTVFPCWFGSALKLTGVDEFLHGLSELTAEPKRPEGFGARVFKIARDPQGARLTFLKVTGGSLRVKSLISGDGWQEKADQLRVYSGTKFALTETAEAGTVCAVTGLSHTEPGDGLGFETAQEAPVLLPVLEYRLVPEDGVSPQEAFLRLRQLAEEDPQLHPVWDARHQEIRMQLMGEVQMEILARVIAERCAMQVTFDEGSIVYKETIADTVEGVGHYEPLRHYAEVHLLLEPGEPGSGLRFDTVCSEDVLARSWQRLILTHLMEKTQPGVLTGAPVTDLRITLLSGRAHLKHTEGGDFRQATYRAVRQGLMQAKSKLLEPYFSFRLEVPSEQIGRAINDIRMKSGSFESPEESGGISVLSGRAPVTELNGYASEVAAYTGGRGRLYCESAGYDDCHNAEKVIAELAYDPEADLENTPDSVFCAHGGGFGVKWNKVGEYMHLESCLEKEKPYTPPVNRRNLHIDDKELEAIMEREFGKPKYELYRPTAKKNDENQTDFELTERKSYVLVDGYNVIFAWDELKNLADTDLGAARERLMKILCNYSAYTKNNVVLVFDAYKVPGNTGERFDFHNIHVVYTKERELGDVYIEKLISEIGKNDRVRVVTSDNLIQLSAVRFGVLRMSAAEFEREVDSVHAKIGKFLDEIREKNPKTKIDEISKI